jgi:hypothetical protein
MDKFNVMKNQLQDFMNKEYAIKYLLYGFIIIFIVCVILYISTNLTKKSRNNSSMTSKLDNAIKMNLSSMSYKDSNRALRDYYICSSYNSCCGGQFKNDYVDLVPLQQVIRTGCRLLDFEIYSLNNRPVIAASSENNYHLKEMYNSVPFVDAIDTIKRYAFSGATCPNPNDPLFLNFRIKSNNVKIYKQMADAINNNLKNKLLDTKYQYEAHGESVVKKPLKTFLNKIIIICDNKEDNFRKVKEFHKLVNMSSGSIFLRSLRYYDVVYTHDFKELIHHNKKYMSIVSPDLSEKDTNMKSQLLTRYGCQFICMCFQNVDTQLKYYLDLFNEAGKAFIVKPKQLRYEPVTIKIPKPPNPAYSFAPRTIDKPYFQSNI